MKRQRPKGTPLPSSIISDIRREVSQEQLAAIGALTLAFNEVEAAIDRLFSIVTGLPDHLQLEVSTRLTGIDGKLEIIGIGAKSIIAEREWQQLTETMGKGAFGLVKGIRDCVIHARHIDPSRWIGVKIDRQAKVYEILLDKKALNSVYDYLYLIGKELDEAAALILSSLALQKLPSDAPNKAQLEAKTAAHLAQFRRYRIERQSLQPLPEFPSESELRVANFQAQQVQTKILMSWFEERWPDYVQPIFRGRAVFGEREEFQALPPLPKEKQSDD